MSGISKKNKKNIDDKVREELIKLLKKYSLTEAVKIVHNLTNIYFNLSNLKFLLGYGKKWEFLTLKLVLFQ